MAYPLCPHDAPPGISTQQLIPLRCLPGVEHIDATGIAGRSALLDQAELDALAAACAEEKRWEFFVSVAPWRFKGATASIANPLALF